MKWILTEKKILPPGCSPVVFQSGATFHIAFLPEDDISKLLDGDYTMLRPKYFLVDARSALAEFEDSVQAALYVLTRGHKKTIPVFTYAGTYRDINEYLRVLYERPWRRGGLRKKLDIRAQIQVIEDQREERRA